MHTDISVVMPMYNIDEEYLRASIESLLSQTKREGVELIITDDGSTNGCGLIADEYALLHKNIQVIHTKNSGAGPARNTAINKAKGKYLAFLDADDIMVSDALEKMFERGEHDCSEIVMINATRFNSEKESQAFIHKNTFRNLKGVTNVLQSPQLIYDTVSWDKLILRDFWMRNKLEYPPTSLYEDIPVMTKALLRAERISIIRSIGYKWRFREQDSKSTTQKRGDIENLRGRLAIMRDLDRMYAEEVSEEAILLEKEVKALKVDLKIYAHACIDMQKEQIERYMQEIGSYIRESISDEAMQIISPVDKAMYEALLSGDTDRFIKLADFGKNITARCLNIEKGGVIYKKVPKELFGSDMLDMTSNSTYRIPKVSVCDVSYSRRRIRFEAQLYFGKISITSPEEQIISASLCDEHTGEEIELPVKYYNNKRLTNIKGTVKDYYTEETAEYNYDGTGFFVDLYPKRLKNVQKAVIIIRYKNRYTEGITLLRGMTEKTQKKVESIEIRRRGYMCSLSVAELKTIKINIKKS